MTDIVGTDTILEGDLPEDAVNYDSLADFAAKTEEEWETELTDAEEARWGDGVLAGLFEGLEQGKPFIAALIEAVVHEVFEDVEDVFEDVGDAFGSMSENFSGKWRDIIAAKDAADYANAQLAVSTRPIKDLFDGAAGALSGDWDIDYYGTLAAGTVEQDGAGSAWWNGSGFAPRTGRCRFNALDTTTDLQIVTIVMPQTVQAPPPLGSQSHMRILGRVNTAADDFVYVEITDDSVAIGYSVGGSETEWDSVGTAVQDGDVWDVQFGTGSDDYEFIVERNGIEVLTYTDTVPDSEMDSSHRSIGFEMFAASRGIFGQTSPGTLAVISADDN